ncbi:zinc finger CCCH domain-containing protein 14 [Nymphalis io]|uniref:zinc finger CCCH domain-containing protein 14 n=1 Tax=Inachis io TaxID=171585 RepID=UPI00216774C4|nr:zinc finger CCCH domain-containing protein 14 [Nymphalis io]
MDGIGNEIGLKMRSAIKAKLTELGCYVDDELPDYVMVMVANKRTRAQMEDDLQLFLGDNTEMFVNWLHQVLKKLQEVTVTPLKAELEKKKERSGSKDRKDKDKKDKVKLKKGESSKKSKKKEKEKARKKEEKKSSKSKKKSKHEMIRPNIPPLLMNIEKDSEPSITDVFAGQILKNHGINLESYKDDLKVTETKTALKEIKRPIVPIIDPATISSQSEDTTQSEDNDKNTDNIINNAPKPNNEDNIQEMNKIEAKIQGLRQKLVEQLDSMSDDEDFLNIRTEAEELMNDFAEDVLQEISQPPPVTPPLSTNKTLYPIQKPIPEIQKPKDTDKEPETLPQIELNLPKRPIRERLGARDVPVQEVKEKESTKKAESPERFTPEKDIESRPKPRSSRRIGSQSDSQKKPSVSEENHEKEPTSKRLTSKVSALGRRGASVGRVRPRPRVGAPASSLLLRAVADAHKSLLNIPPKIEHGSQKIKRALVLPMRRCMENQKIVIQVPGDTHSDSRGDAVSLRDIDNEGDNMSSKNTKEDEFVPQSITKVIHNVNNKGKRPSSRLDDNIMDTITIHNTTVDKDKGTQFIVTMDGYHPNAFLAKKLLTEGILDEDDAKETGKPEQKATQKQTKDAGIETENNKETGTSISLLKKRLSNTSEESNTQVIIKQDHDLIEMRKSPEEIESVNKLDDSPPVKKRKASPIIFDVDKKEKDRVRERTVSASSDSHVTLTSTSNTHKYDDLPPLSQAERKAVWCRSFPLCRFGPSCAFQHPRCKFAAACTRRGCCYSHAPPAEPPAEPLATAAPLLASHVVPAANYKSISAVVPPSMCRFYPNCVNPTCHYYHPKPCRFGKACTNKLECNFYHNDVPSKWKYSV